jgi:ectoine hydroxylase-related dioxygenase (phytanoyl-CoA dioxygenase family)
MGAMTETTVALSKAQVDAFRSQGFLFPLRLVPPEKVVEWRDAWERFEAEAKLVENRLNNPHSVHLEQEFAAEIVCWPPLLDCIEALIGPEILLLGSRFFIKWPGDATTVAWHQDAHPAKRLFPPELVTAWYAFDPVGADAGAMSMIPGSHLAGVRDHRPAQNEGSLLRINQELPLTADEAARAVSVTLAAGEISIHDGRVVHSSGANTSSRRRCGLAVRYVPAHVRQIGAELDELASAITVRSRGGGERPVP